MMQQWSRFLSLPLRIKLLLGILAAATLIFFVSLVALNRFDQALPTASTALMERLARERQTMLTHVVEHGTSNAARLANDPLLVPSYVSLSNNLNDIAAFNQLQLAFRLMLNTQPTVRQVRFVSTEGRILVSVPLSSASDDTGELYYDALKDKLPLQPTEEVYIASVSNAGLDFVSIPVRGKALGFVVLELDTSGAAAPLEMSFYKALTPVDSPNGRMNFYVLDNLQNLTTLQGIVLLGRGAGDNITQLRDLAKQSISLPKATQFTSLLSEQPVIGVALAVPNSDFVLIAEQPIAQSPLTNDRLQFLIPTSLAMLIALVALALVGLWLDQSIVRPMEKLLTAVSSFAQGHILDSSTQITQQDEIGHAYQALMAFSSQFRSDSDLLESRIQQRLSEIEATYSIAQAVAKAPDLRTMFEQAGTLLQERFTFLDHVRIYLLDENKRTLTLIETNDQADSNPEHSLVVDGLDPIGQAILEAKPSVLVHTAHAENGTSGGVGSDRLLPGMQAELALPLHVAENQIGVLDLQSAQRDPFSENEIVLFERIAEQIALAINTRRTVEQAERRLNEAESFRRQLSGNDWQQFLNARRVYRTQAQTVNANEWSSVQRKAIETGSLVESIGPEVVTFALPVSLRGEMLGAIEWDVPLALYNDNVRQLAVDLANRLAVSADNARLFEQAQRVAQRERLVNDIAGKLVSQTDVSEILKVAVKEVGLALRLPQTSIRLVTAPNDKPTQGNED